MPKLLKESVGITVTAFASEEDIRQICEPILIWNPRLKEAIQSGKYIIRSGSEECYNEQTGLEVRKPEAISEALFMA